MIKLQVALDFFSLDEAIKVAEKVASAGVDILEIGTPLIHFEGLKNSLEKIGRIASKYGKEVLADLKLADVGYETAKQAFSLGANIITVLASADDSTIEGVVKASKEFNGKVMADLILSKNPEEDSNRVLKLGVDYVLVHLGIDVQKKMSILDYLRKIRIKVPPEKLALAGGINLQMLEEIIKIRPGVIIVGRAITKSEDPYSTARMFLQRLHSSKL